MALAESVPPTRQGSEEKEGTAMTRVFVLTNHKGGVGPWSWFEAVSVRIPGV